MKRMHIALAAAALLAASAQPVRADDNERDDNQRLQGSFVVAITLDAAPTTPAPGLVTYNTDGGVIANEIVDLSLFLPAGTLFTEDHGAWHRLRNGKFLVTFIKLASLNGHLVASLKTRAEVQSNGETFSGRFRVDVLKPDGTPLVPFPLTGSITGKRINAEPL